MIDLIYIASTVAFFAACIGYVAFCARLGGKQSGEEQS
jgi:hypothetical protein